MVVVIVVVVAVVVVVVVVVIVDDHSRFLSQGSRSTSPQNGHLNLSATSVSGKDQFCGIIGRPHVCNSTGPLMAKALPMEKSR